MEMPMIESVPCPSCEGRGQIYVGSEFVTCPKCGGQQHILRTKKAPQKASPKRQDGTSGRSKSSSSGGSFLGGIILVTIVGAVLWQFVTEQALPALSANWPWIVWYIVLIVLPSAAVLLRANNLTGLTFIPEVVLAVLIVAKFYLGDFWSDTADRSMNLSTVFLLSCFATSVFFMFHKGQYGLSHSITDPPELALALAIFYFPILAVLFLITVWATSLEFWDGFAWIKPYLLPSFATIYPPLVAYFFRSHAFFQQARQVS